MNFIRKCKFRFGQILCNVTVSEWTTRKIESKNILIFLNHISKKFREIHWTPIVKKKNKGRIGLKGSILFLKEVRNRNDINHLYILKTYSKEKVKNPIVCVIV